jgi:quinol monooxygenase YgiN
MTGLFLRAAMNHTSKRSVALSGSGLAAALLAAMTAFGAQEGADGSANAVVELRQYTLHPGERDVLIDLFERNFVESQEAEGMSIIGTFRDLDNPDRFVWLRGFPDMVSRAAALNGFYQGAVWKAHRAVANATMIDSGNVLLLRAARPGAGFQRMNGAPPPREATGVGRGLIEASIVYLRPSAAGDFVDFFEKELEPQWRSAGGSVVAKLVTDHSANTFPALPVREGENVFVWFTAFADQSAWAEHRRVLGGSGRWRATVGALSLWTHQPIERLRLQPTVRSRLQGVTVGGMK